MEANSAPARWTYKVVFSLSRCLVNAPGKTSPFSEFKRGRLAPGLHPYFACRAVVITLLPRYGNSWCPLDGRSKITCSNNRPTGTTNGARSSAAPGPMRLQPTLAHRPGGGIAGVRPAAASRPAHRSARNSRPGSRRHRWRSCTWSCPANRRPRNCPRTTCAAQAAALWPANAVAAAVAITAAVAAAAAAVCLRLVLHPTSPTQN